MKNKITQLGIVSLLAILMTTIFFSCKKDKNDLPNTNPSGQWNNSTMTKATFLGQVLKEDGSALDGATVTTGTHMMTTDADGFFYFSNISTPQNATLIKVEKAGYFKAFRTVHVIPNQDNQVRIMAMELPSPESLDATTGGTITISNGGSIDFPANAIIDENTNQPYTGNVSVYAKWIDPSSDDLWQLLPGDLRAINSNGQERGLTTFGMQAVELVGSAGQKLQLGNNKLANVSFPIPASMLANAPSSIPLWHFDENQGMWVEEGEASLTGNQYEGAVSHFSFWNVDIPTNGPPVSFTATFVDQNNNPLVGYYVRIVPSTNLGSASGLINSSGILTGTGLPSNTSFNLEVFDFYSCGLSNPLHSQVFSSTTTNVNLGTITVNISTNTSAVVSGTAVDCNNSILVNTPVKFTNGSYVGTVTTNSSGVFTTTINCLTGPTSITFTAFDVSNAVNGSLISSITPNTNTNVGSIAACGTLNQFINWTSNDGTTTTSWSVLDGVNGSSFNQIFTGSTTIISGNDSSLTPQYVSFLIDGPQSLGTHSLIGSGYSDHLSTGMGEVMVGTPVVNITNYQAIGGFIAGNFIVVINSSGVPSSRTITCSFRVKRLQ
jgi:hypothetical protein